jgi:alpha-glucosidase
VKTEKNGVRRCATDFLDPKLRYSAQIYRDGDKADYRHDGTDHVIESKEVNRS